LQKDIRRQFTTKCGPVSTFQFKGTYCIQNQIGLKQALSIAWN